jgi:hypothetical protein
MSRQPVNELAPWGVETRTGEYVGVTDGGLIATTAVIGKVVFQDGTVMKSAGVSVPNPIDSGTF